MRGFTQPGCQYHFAAERNHLQILCVKAENANVVSSDTEIGMSLINTINKAGPSRDPCGTPDVTGNHSELFPSMTTRCSLSCR